MATEKEPIVVTISPDIAAAYLEALLRLFQLQYWKPREGLSDITIITTVISMAGAVGDDAFRQTVLKAGAEYLSRAAETPAT